MNDQPRPPRLAKSKAIADALRAFKPGAFTDRDELAFSYPHVVRRPHFLVERTTNGYRMTVSLGEGDRVYFFDTPGEVNRARQALTDLGVIGLVREGG